MVDGQPIPENGTVMSLEHVDSNRYRVKDEYSSGPPKVASRAYRSGWDRTFNKPSEKDLN